MSKTLLIDPVSRIEGHAKITIYLDDTGAVNDARFHVTEFRGFEKFCEGRPIGEMPSLTARICGICPVSHLLASAKTGDDILSVRIPIGAQKLRRLMNLGQIVQSHALSFFHLSAPDFLLGFDSPPAQRNVFGLMAANPDLARGGIRLRQFGQTIIELLGGRKIHPAWAVPGGVRSGITEDAINQIRDRLPESFAVIQQALQLFKSLLNTFYDEAQHFGNFPSLYMSLVGKDGAWEHYDGILRMVSSSGVVLRDIEPHEYAESLGEAVEAWNYLKYPYFKPMGYPAGMYRVGPLARLNVCTHIGTPLADAELSEFRQRVGNSGVVSSSFQYHYARLIEILAGLERIGRLIDDPDIRATHLRADAGINQTEGVGISEAPRGTLIHHYQVDSHGLISRMNLIIATGQNNLAMNRTVKQIAQHYILPEHQAAVPEGMLNRIEAGIRAFDPCLSCSTHALGQMPMHVSVVNCEGEVVAERSR
jgi:NAD-reducing hydrogenase large subunit